MSKKNKRRGTPLEKVMAENKFPVSVFYKRFPQRKGDILWVAVGGQMFASTTRFGDRPAWRKK